MSVLLSCFLTVKLIPHEQGKLIFFTFFTIQKEETEVPSTPALPCSQTRRSAESPANAESVMLSTLFLLFLYENLLMNVLLKETVCVCCSGRLGPDIPARLSEQAVCSPRCSSERSAGNLLHAHTGEWNVNAIYYYDDSYYDYYHSVALCPREQRLMLVGVIARKGGR